MSDTEKFICDAAFENWWSGLNEPRSGHSTAYRYADNDNMVNKFVARAVWRACWDYNEQINQKAKLHEPAPDAQ